MQKGDIEQLVSIGANLVAGEMAGASADTPGGDCRWHGRAEAVSLWTKQENDHHTSTQDREKQRAYRDSQPTRIGSRRCRKFCGVVRPAIAIGVRAPIVEAKAAASERLLLAWTGLGYSAIDKASSRSGVERCDIRRGRLLDKQFLAVAHTGF